MKYSQSTTHQTLMGASRIGSDMVSKELLRTKQLFAVDVSRAHRLLSQATAKKGSSGTQISHIC